MGFSLKPFEGLLFLKKKKQKDFCARGVGVAVFVLLVLSGQALATTPQQMQAGGRWLYLRFNCYSCHGVHGEGGIGPNIQQVDVVNTSEALLGGEPGGMISFKKQFSQAWIADMAAYLAVAGTSQEPTFLNWWQMKAPPR